ncbi:DUF2523 family protein [Pasteurella multocida]
MGVIIKFLVKAFSGILSFIFSSAVLKFLIFGIVFISVTEIVPILIEVFLPDDVDLNGLLSDIPSESAYFLQFFKIDVGIKSILSAYASRFLIRRIPFIG